MSIKSVTNVHTRSSSLHSYYDNIHLTTKLKKLPQYPYTLAETFSIGNPKLSKENIYHLHNNT